MSSIVTNILSLTVGLLSNKVRDSTADKLKDGDVTDAEIRKFVVRELNDIKSKIDGLSRSTLLASYNFLQEGVELLDVSLDKSNPEQKASETQDERGEPSSVIQSGILNQAIELPHAMEMLKTNSDREFATARKRFEEAHKTATTAFMNEAFSIEDRIFAAKLRIVSEILEHLDSPETAITGCLSFLKKLHSLPAIQETFSVYLNGGIKSLLNKTKRAENVKSVMLINYVLFQYVWKFSGKYTFEVSASMPTIELPARSFHPIIHWCEIKRLELPELTSIVEALDKWSRRISQQNEIMMATDDRTAVQIYTKEGNLKTTIKVPEYHMEKDGKQPVVTRLRHINLSSLSPSEQEMERNISQKKISDTKRCEEGVVVSLSSRQNYVFIKADSNEYDRNIFFHRNSLMNREQRPHVGEGVQFYTTKTKKGYQANEIRVQEFGGIHPVVTRQLDRQDYKNQSRKQYHANENREKNHIVKARSLALRFMAVYPCCVRAIPYCNTTNNDNRESKTGLFTMCLYLDNDGKKIPEELEQASNKMFADYTIEYIDIKQLEFCKLVTHLPASKRSSTQELKSLTKEIGENLNVFENRLNVMAVQASYKIKDSIETDIPCVTVYVIGKGRIPAGETDILEINKLGDYPFDIVEGYHQPCVIPQRSYVYSLLAGYGIGVQSDGGIDIGVDGACVGGVGTLGGFLEDKNGGHYLLSCQHVLCPDENNNSQKVIVQPAECDYKEECSDAETHIKRCEKELEKLNSQRQTISDSDLLKINKNEKSRKRIERELGTYRNVVESVPRPIGKYCDGLKQNEEVEFSDGTTGKIYVDAAFAELESDEASKIESDKDDEPQTGRCPVFGFRKEDLKNNICSAPTGEIVDRGDFTRELTNRPDLQFWKVGRTTGFTFGIRETDLFQSHLAYKREICAGDLSLVLISVFCGDCEELTNENQVDLSCLEETQYCANCNKEIKIQASLSSTPALWAYNCLTIRKPLDIFCDKGDSGALVFDVDGRAWGILSGQFTIPSKNLRIGLVVPLWAALQALGQRSGKEFKLWCI